MGAFKQYLNENEEIQKKIFAILDEMDEDEIDEFGAYLYDEFFEDDDSVDEADKDEADKDELFTLEDVKEMIEALGEDMLDEVLEMLEEDESEDEDEDLDESLNEDWIKLSQVKAGKVQKIKTNKSGKNYFYVVSFDEKDKEFEVVTPKAYNNGDTDKTMTISFDDVTSVSTDDLDEAMARRMKVKKMNKKKRKFMKKTKADLRKTVTVRKREARKSRPKRKRIYRANKIKIKSYQKSRSVAIKKGKHKVKVRRAA